jgi:hypothetical protein
MWVDQRGSEVLSRNESLRLLALAAKQGQVGRLAASTSGAPLVQPVNFAYDNGCVLVRVGERFMAGKVPGHVVAFEVDGTGPGSGSGYDIAWSVLVRGLATSPSGSMDSAAGFAPSPMPLVPHPGSRLVAIRPDVVTGRRFTLRQSDLPSAAMRQGSTVHTSRRSRAAPATRRTT